MCYLSVSFYMNRKIIQIMKSNIIIILSVFVLSFNIYAAEPQEVTSQIKGVTVFLRGAQISRQTIVTLQKGMTTLAFRELPVNIDPQSIQARGEGNFIILSLLHQVNYLAGQRKTAQVMLLQDSLKTCEEKYAFITGMQSVMKNEEDLLIANRDIGGSEKGVVIAELKIAADFYRARLTEIKKEQIKLTREAAQVSEIIEKLRDQLNVLNAGLNRPTSEVLVNVSCNENVTANILISYTVYDAGWVPAYDVRAKDVQSPVQLIYNARVSQHTGEDWNRVAIKLSTANPQQRGDKPNLQPWYIDLEKPVGIMQDYNVVRSGITKKAYAVPLVVEETEEESLMEPEVASTAASFTEISERQTNLEFNIQIPYDIPSDNKQYTINIQDNSLPASYEYYCAPKLDREAFLVARITDWENLNLLSGEINLFFEGTYVGKSNLNVRNTNDTLDLSLGRDKGIVVTRVKMKDFTEEKTIGSNKRETRAWEITIRNNKKQAINLRIEDQLPVSMNKDIEVEPLDYSGGNYNKETGRVVWKVKMEPSDEKKLRVSFAIKYPTLLDDFHRIGQVGFNLWLVLNARLSDHYKGQHFFRSFDIQHFFNFLAGKHGAAQPACAISHINCSKQYILYACPGALNVGVIPKFVYFIMSQFYATFKNSLVRLGDQNQHHRGIFEKSGKPGDLIFYIFGSN
jgi:uncharacterized protein (TIGR02231 family)